MSRNVLLVFAEELHCRFHKSPSFCQILGSPNSLCTCLFCELRCNVIITLSPSPRTRSLPMITSCRAYRMPSDSIIQTILGEECSSGSSSFSLVSSYFLVQNPYCIKTEVLQFCTPGFAKNEEEILIFRYAHYLDRLFPRQESTYVCSYGDSAGI
jgi:hypothetical protein